MDRFSELLNELGNLINVPLYPDKHRACKVNINNTLNIQLECDTAKERLLVATLICTIPPGKFRENILKEALKANTEFPRIGTLAYSERNNKLVLFEYLTLEELTGEKLVVYMSSFFDKANSWRIAIESGGTVPTAPTTVKSSTPIFGIKT